MDRTCRAADGTERPDHRERDPTIGTLVRSFQNRAGTEFVGLNNYAWFFGNSAALSALKNNVIWLVLLTTLTVGLGLLIAILVDRVRYESIAKSVIPFMIGSAGSAIEYLIVPAEKFVSPCFFAPPTMVE